jgi:hypothetical protein
LVVSVRVFPEEVNMWILPSNNQILKWTAYTYNFCRPHLLSKYKCSEGFENHGRSENTGVKYEKLPLPNDPIVYSFCPLHTPGHACLQTNVLH